MQFGLEFEVAAEQPAEGSEGADTPAALPALVKTEPSLPATTGASPHRKKPRENPARAEAKRTEAEAAGQPEPVKQDGMGEVVRLDRFRKK